MILPPEDSRAQAVHSKKTGNIILNPDHMKNKLLTIALTLLASVCLAQVQPRKDQQQEQKVKVGEKPARDQYVADLQNKIDELDKKIEKLTIKAKEKKKENDAAFKKAFDDLEAKERALREKLKEYNEASEDKLENLKTQAKDGLDELEIEFNKVLNDLDKEMVKTEKEIKESKPKENNSR